MKLIIFLFSLPVVFTSITYAAEGETCKDLAGKWSAVANAHKYTLYISPTQDDCRTHCVVHRVSYTLNSPQQNKLFCYEGQEGVIGQGPMVIAFEGSYGGHSIGTYNRQLKLLWTGVVPKNSDGKWLAHMDSYWFKKVSE